MSRSEIREPKSEKLSLRERRSHPAVRNYMLLCLSALFLLVVCLAYRGLDWWSLVPTLIGCLTLLTYWNHGPPLVLLSLTGLLGMSEPHLHSNLRGWSRLPTPTLMDFLLCVAVLAYVLGHYRLLALMRHIFPQDPRRRRNNPAQQRCPDLVTDGETVLLGLALLLWTGLAGIAWTWIIDYAPPLDIALEWWRVLRLVWAVLAVLAIGGIVASYVRQSAATPQESLLYLQDQCWRLTRREQSMLNRWWTWARLRTQRKKGSL